jgi:thioredoxin-dependent peroxiredoxin
MTSKKGNRMALEIGSPAPDFSLPDETGRLVSLATFKGKKIVLYFYPKDDTSGCTIEAKDFSCLIEDFAKEGAVVIGMSPDSTKSHVKFRAKHELNISLLADEEKRAIEAYGLWVEKSMYGKKYMGVKRSTFLIGKDGRIDAMWIDVKVPGHADAVLETVKNGK